ncbi:MAG: formylmethanofuran--tetrahydromethanopterin N-formyltransferase, partial [Candidatus Helarchaeota archaeon]
MDTELSNSIELDGTGELFPLWMSRILITAVSPEWALTAARMASGFGYKDGIEAGIDIRTTETPDKRYGVSLMIAAPTKKSLEKEMARRITQSIISTPTTSVFDYMIDDPEIEKIKVGDSISFFADGHQLKGILNDRQVWSVPSFDGDFFIESEFGIKSGVSTNLIIMGSDPKNILQACMTFSEIIQEIPCIMSPYPGGFTR